MRGKLEKTRKKWEKWGWNGAGGRENVGKMGQNGGNLGKLRKNKGKKGELGGFLGYSQKTYGVWGELRGLLRDPDAGAGPEDPEEDPEGRIRGERRGAMDGAGKRGKKREKREKKRKKMGIFGGPSGLRPKNPLRKQRKGSQNSIPREKWRVRPPKFPQKGKMGGGGTPKIPSGKKGGPTKFL